MKRFIGLVISILIATNANAAPTFTETELKAKTSAFLKAKEAKQQPKTQEADIDHFLSFFADEFKDEHVKFNVTETSKIQFKENLLNKMKDEIAYNKIDIHSMLVGANVVAVQFTESGKVKPSHLNKFIEYEVSHIMVLEFDDKGFIKHLRRHHGR